MEEITFYQKVVLIQTSLKAPKGQFNSFGGYKYRSCEDILEAIKPLLIEAGLFLTITDSIECVDGRHYVKAIAKLSDGTNSIECVGVAREPQQKKGMDEAQITGATSSYARKYALNGLLCIDDAKDADAYADVTALKKQVFKIAEDKKIPTDKVKDFMFKTFKKHSANELTADELAELEKWLKAYEV